MLNFEMNVYNQKADNARELKIEENLKSGLDQDNQALAALSRTRLVVFRCAFCRA
jgi:hypothetical protein